MLAKINQIPVKDPTYQNLKIQKITSVKDIYRAGQFCDVKFVTIREDDDQKPVYPTDVRYALKTISKEKIKLNSDNFDREYLSIYNQIVSLYLLEHPNIVKIFWHFEDEDSIYILMQYGGTKLLNYSRKKDLDQDKIKQIFKQICLAALQFHTKGIMHRDLSMQNIVILSQTTHITLIDFGFANQFTGGRTTALGTLSIMAPEVYHQKKYNSKADVWSLGIILYELFHKRNPFAEDNQEYTEEQYTQRRDKLQFNIDKQKMSNEARKMIQKMLSLSPDKRPSVQQILNSKWMSGRQESDQFFNFELRESDDNKKTIHMAMNIKQRKSAVAFSGSQNDNIFLKDPFAKSVRGSEKDDDFFFDKVINKMTVNNSVKELEHRLQQFLHIRAQEMNKKKRLVLEYLSIQKQKIRAQLESLQK